MTAADRIAAANEPRRDDFPGNPTGAALAKLDRALESRWLGLHPAALQGFVGEAVRTIDPTTEAAQVGVLVTLLASAGACIGGGPHVWAGDVKHAARLWPLLIGATASGRKGTSWAAAARLLEAADPAFRASNVVTGLTTGEGLIGHVRDPEKRDDDGTDPKDQDKRRLSPHPGVSDKRRLIIEEEFAGVLARGKREGSSLSAVLRQAWDGTQLATMTRSDPLQATGAHLVVVAHVTAGELRLRLSEADLRGGLFNRFLPVVVRRSKRLPDGGGLAPGDRDRLAAVLRRRMETARTLHRIQRTELADRLWSERLYTVLTPDDEIEGPVGQVIARAAPHVLRLSLLYALLDGCHEIDADHLIAAAALWRYVESSAKETFGETSGSKHLNALLAFVTKGGSAGRTRTEVGNLFARSLPEERVDALVGQMVARAGFHETVDAAGPRGGRPRTRYYFAAEETEETEETANGTGDKRSSLGSLGFLGGIRMETRRT